MLAKLSARGGNFGRRFPTRDTPLEICGTVATVFAWTDLIAGHKLHQFFYTLEIDPFFFNESTQTFQPHNVIRRVITISIPPHGGD